MNSSNYIEYRNLISNLSEDHFNEFVLSFVKDYYNTKDAYISNGPYDGGNDLVVNKNGHDIKLNVQLTIQTDRLSNKILEDVEKASKNVTKYAYVNHLYFYCNHHISGERQNTLKQTALFDYNITLEIYDNYRLAELMSEYPSMLKVLRKVIGHILPAETLTLDRNTKILFDYLSMNKNIGEIKVNFIISFILFHLYSEGASSVEQIYISLNTKFSGKITKLYCEQLVGKLKERGLIELVDDNKPKKYIISEGTKKQLETIEDNSTIQERQLLDELHQILSRYKVQLDTHKIIGLIIKMFHENYSLDIEELVKKSPSQKNTIKKTYNSLVSYIKQYSQLESSQIEDLAANLITACNANPLINKSSISSMFVNLFQSDKLDDYLNNEKRILYLDTQILLQIICITYKEFDNHDMLYSMARSFYKTVSSSSDVPISLHTTTGYVDEVVRHLYNALKLERFLSLPYIKALGPSKNVFFNFYQQLLTLEHYDSFSDFVESLLDIDITDFKEEDFIQEATSIITNALESLKIRVENIPIFDDYVKYQKEYENTLSYYGLDKKSYDARKNDLNTILYISDKLNNITISPYLITWDTSFYKVRKCFQKFKELGYWYIYSPQKFANTLSVLNFKIDPTSVNNNIISFVEENFNASSETISFLDLLNGLFYKKDLSEWQFARKIAKMREQLQKDNEISDKVEYPNLPIDEMLLLLQNEYQNSPGQFNHSDLISLFQDNAYSDPIIDIIKKYIDSYKNSENKISQNIVAEINLLIAQQKKL